MLVNPRFAGRTVLRASAAILVAGASFFVPTATAQVGCDATGSTALSAPSTRIGQTLAIRIDGPPNSPFALFGAFDPGPTGTPFGPICVSTDPDPPAGFRIFVNSIQGPGPTLDAGGLFTLSRPVPDLPGLVGRTFYMQAATSAGGVVLSNSLTLIVGESATHRAPLNGMARPRTLHAVDLLESGEVLITGGGAGSLTSPQASNTADLYSTAFKEVRATAGTMNRARALHATVILPGGRVLICGGVNSAGVVHQTAEEYDPTTGMFSAVGSMGSPRAGHAACLLGDGRVLIVGGTTSFEDSAMAFENALATAEIYDPTGQAFSPVPVTLSEARLLHTATVLQDGTVLIAGGIKGTGLFGLPTLATDGEIFDPTDDSFSGAGALDTTRAGHGAILLPDGRVLLAGGIDGIAQAQAEAELFTPGSGFAATGDLPEPKAGAMMALLGDGTVLETGGLSGSLIAPTGIASASIFDPSQGNFTATGALTVARGAHRIVALPDGSVLSIGGAADEMTVHDSIDRYYP